MSGETSICPACKAEIEEGAMFCPKCGANIAELRKAEEAQKAQLACKCPKCGKEVPADTKFCPSCGTNLEEANAAQKTKFCVSCGAQIDMGTAFCPKCGANQNGAMGAISVQADSKQSKSKKKKWIIIGVVAFLALCTIVTVIDEDLSNDSANSNYTVTSNSSSASNSNTVAPSISNSPKTQPSNQGNFTNNQQNSSDPIVFKSADDFYDHMTSCSSKYQKVHVSMIVEDSNTSLDGMYLSSKTVRTHNI